MLGNKGIGGMMGHMENMMRGMHEEFESSFKRAQEMMESAER